jgi:aspartyl protease family protein
VRTKSQAGHQLVDAILFGLNGQRRNARLMVDTGASAIVLPRSMIPALGYVEAELGEVTMQTANGLVKGRMAVLERVAVGRSVADDVAAAFVEDGALAGNMLLGMSFLGRFRMTIDKARNSITLEDK